MKRIFSILIFIPLITSSQVWDDFSDGNFSANPIWLGDTSEYKISTYSNGSWSQQPRLQLNGLVADVSNAYILAPAASLDNYQWDFWVRLSLNTSNTNNLRVYLASDNVNLEGSLNGYFVQFGDDTDASYDSISLNRQDGSIISRIISGTIAYTGASSSYRIKVLRDNAGLWQLFSDNTGGQNFGLEGSATDITHQNSSCFGFFCRYTLSNSTAFYFDDIYVGPEIVDTTGPDVLQLIVIDQTHLDLHFSEVIDQVTAENNTNYTAAGLGFPTSAIKDPVNGTIVHLTFSATFSPGTIYTLSIQNVMDLYSNTMDSQNIDFAWYVPQSYDVVINEIMADPDPPVGLPNYEYIELYNTTAFPLQLNGWTVYTGSTAHTLPDIVIAAGSFLLLCDNDASGILSTFGQVASFSSFSVTNSGTTITLRDNTGNLNHSISFTDSWYHDNTKKDGGWSIEQIDPENPCGESMNWKASLDVNGGTPGQTNSVFSYNPDQISPYLANVSAISSMLIRATFSESVDSISLSNPASWQVNNGIGSPVSVTPMGPDFKTVLISLPSPLSFTAIYSLTFSDTVFDCSGNGASALSRNFSLYQPTANEIVINEIMADPDPVIALPNFEYLELYNRSAFPISLYNWSVIFGSSRKMIPDISIDAGAYLILSPEGSYSSFSSFGPTAEISGMSISNTGQTIALHDTLDRLISFVEFTDQWYQNPNKDEGGWSLEQIDPSNPCGGSSNWSASLSPYGGSPGSLNSNSASNLDNDNPKLIRASASRIELDKVRLFFNEPLDSTTLKFLNRYTIDNGIGNPISLKLVPQGNRELVLTLAVLLQYDVIYNITVSDSIADCVGNLTSSLHTVRFAIPRLPDSGDIVINEILSNPRGDGVDYIEIYNRSQKITDLADLNLSSFDTINNILDDVEIINTSGFLVFPGDFIVLTSDPGKVKEQYMTLNPDGFNSMASFPSYSNDNGTVVLSAKTGAIIDAVSYMAELHFALLNSTEGVSLERINFERPSTDFTNWHSAAGSVGYGTPAYKNSEYLETVSDDGAISISPEIFSPDNDGYNDVLNISYDFGQAGFVATICIYDSRGRVVRKLINNEMLAVSGIFSWDGTTDTREKAGIGIYIIYAEVFDLDGKVKHYKKTAVLATRL